MVDNGDLLRILAAPRLCVTGSKVMQMTHIIGREADSFPYSYSVRSCGCLRRDDLA